MENQCDMEIDMENNVVHVDFKSGGFKKAATRLLEMSEKMFHPDENQLLSVSDGDESAGQGQGQAQGQNGELSLPLPLLPNPALDESLFLPLLMSLLETENVENENALSVLAKLGHADVDFLIRYCKCLLMGKGKTKVPESNVEYLMLGAKKLQVQMESVVKQCTAIRSNQMNPDNCGEIHKFAVTHDFPDLAGNADTYIKNNYNIIAQTQTFLRFSFEVLNQRIEDCSKAVTKDAAIFESIIRWTNHDEEARLAHFPDLLKHINKDELTLESQEILDRAFTIFQRIDDPALLHLYVKLQHAKIAEYSRRDRDSLANADNQSLPLTGTLASDPVTSSDPIIPENHGEDIVDKNGGVDSDAESQSQPNISDQGQTSLIPTQPKPTPQSSSSSESEEDPEDETEVPTISTNGDVNISKRGRKRKLTKKAIKSPPKPKHASSKRLADLECGDESASKKKNRQCYPSMEENFRLDVPMLSVRTGIPKAPRIWSRDGPRGGRVRVNGNGSHKGTGRRGRPRQKMPENEKA